MTSPVPRHIYHPKIGIGNQKTEWVGILAQWIGLLLRIPDFPHGSASLRLCYSTLLPAGEPKRQKTPATR